jgi:hypothetical protein
MLSKDTDANWQGVDWLHLRQVKRVTQDPDFFDGEISILVKLTLRLSKYQHIIRIMSVKHPHIRDTLKYTVLDTDASHPGLPGTIDQKSLKKKRIIPNDQVLYIEMCEQPDCSGDQACSIARFKQGVRAKESKKLGDEFINRIEWHATTNRKHKLLRFTKYEGLMSAKTTYEICKPG